MDNPRTLLLCIVGSGTLADDLLRCLSRRRRDDSSGDIGAVRVVAIIGDESILWSPTRLPETIGTALLRHPPRDCEPLQNTPSNRHELLTSVSRRGPLVVVDAREPGEDYGAISDAVRLGIRVCGARGPDLARAPDDRNGLLPAERGYRQVRERMMTPLSARPDFEHEVNDGVSVS